MIAKLSKGIFWDVDREQLDAVQHKSFIVSRVLSRGTFNDFKVLLKIYNKQELIATIKKIENLDPKSANFASQIFQIPKREMLCFTRNVSARKHWNY